MKMIRMVSGAVLLGVALNVDSGAAEPAASPASTDSGTASGPALSPYPGPVGEGDFVIGPTYTNAPELTVKEGVPQGTVHHFTMSSTDSKFYPGLPPRNSPPGTPIAPYTRDVWVYVPSQYAAGTLPSGENGEPEGSRDRRLGKLDFRLCARRLAGWAAHDSPRPRPLAVHRVRRRARRSKGASSGG